MGVFDDFRAEVYPYHFDGELVVGTLVGGVPSDPKVAEGWLRTKLGATADSEVQRLVATIMAERGITAEEAVQIANQYKNLNGFRRGEMDGDHPGQLYIGGYQLKAALKEAVSVANASGTIKKDSWGLTRKNLLAFLAEHVFVREERLYLWTVEGSPITEPTSIQQRFVHTWKGTGIQYEEIVNFASIRFRVVSDWDFDHSIWAKIWLTGGYQGLGATRSMGFGTYEVTRWDAVSAKTGRKLPAKRAKASADVD